jgi:hypothetical protein
VAAAPSVTGSLTIATGPGTPAPPFGHNRFAIHPRAALGSVRRALAPTASYPPTRLPPLRVPDRAVFDKLLQVLVFGCGYRRIADATCSATTIRRRRDEWAAG